MLGNKLDAKEEIGKSTIQPIKELIWWGLNVVSSFIFSFTHAYTGAKLAYSTNDELHANTVVNNVKNYIKLSIASNPYPAQFLRNSIQLGGMIYMFYQTYTDFSKSVYPIIFSTLGVPFTIDKINGVVEGSLGTLRDLYYQHNIRPTQLRKIIEVFQDAGELDKLDIKEKVALVKFIEKICTALNAQIIDEIKYKKDLDTKCRDLAYNLFDDSSTPLTRYEAVMKLMRTSGHAQLTLLEKEIPGIKPSITNTVPVQQGGDENKVKIENVDQPPDTKHDKLSTTVDVPKDKNEILKGYEEHLTEITKFMTPMYSAFSSKLPITDVFRTNDIQEKEKNLLDRFQGLKGSLTQKLTVTQ